MPRWVFADRTQTDHLNPHDPVGRRARGACHASAPNWLLHIDLLRWTRRFQAKPMDKKIEGQTRPKSATQSHRTKALPRSAMSAGPPDSTDKMGLSALS